MTDLFAALALALFLEGALWALFPDAMKKAMLHVLAQPVSTIRYTGLAVAVAGIAVLWLIRG